MADSIPSPEAEAWAAPEYETQVLQPVLGRAVQVAPVCSTASTSPAMLHSHKCAGGQQTGISASFCLSSATKGRQAARSVLHVRDCVPHPPPKATAKLSPEHLGSEAKPNVHQLGTDKEQTSGTITLLGIPASAPALAPLPATGQH